MTIEQYFGDWTKAIDLQQANKIMRYLASLRQPVCPNIKDIFKAFRLCPLSKVRVVIIGQDPYFNYINNVPVATGLAFANASDTLEKNYSPSLKVLRDSVIDFTMPHNSIIFEPDLESWEEQGVLLLNTSLSCIKGSPRSHTLLWRPFITSLLANIPKYNYGLVYVLMGSDAQSLEPYIEHQYNHIIKCRHPAYYARMKEPMPSDIWKKINDILIAYNGYGIQWYKEVKF